MRTITLPLLVLVSCSPLFAADPPVNFARDVLPVLSENCFTCHGPDAKARKGDLRLDTKADALRTESPVITPGKAADSEFFKRLITNEESELMPPAKTKKKLTPQQIETLKRWIDQGAAWGNHWSLEKPQRSPVPLVSDARFRVRNPIDAFILSRLKKEGLQPSAEAPKETLLRRVTLDLTGLPPTPAEVDAFLRDTSPDAYEKVVERLLASNRFGERMIWEWLDAARYADSNGYQGDNERTMWPWRDWAVQAFNSDMPFDQFTIWQLAGDMLPNATREQKLATGFLRNHMINGEGGRIPDENRIEYVFDMTETVGTIWLGLTLNCSRCHDHKYDPVLQREYYGLFAFFNQTPISGGGGDPQTKPIVELLSPDDESRLKDANDKIASLAKELDELEAKLFPRAQGKTAGDSDKTKDLPKEIRDLLKTPASKRNRNQLGTIEKHFAKSEPKYAEKLKAQGAQIAAREDLNRRVARVMVMEDIANPRDTFILSKGLYNKPTEKVSAAVPVALPPLPAGAPKNRLALARWLVSPENPLTARVAVNRLWQQIFGTGLVKTVEDFGVQGERPINPELLDWLAVELREPSLNPGNAKPWSLKHLIRLIVTSSTYRQSSKVSAELAERDPENRLLARGPRFRLSSWMIRDQALAASGLFVEKFGGPAVHPYQPPGIWEEATFGNKKYPQGHGEDLYRRSLYTFWRRIIGPTMFFDTATRQTCTVKQTRTNTPLHALTTLNDVTFVEAARVLAQRVMKAETDDSQRFELIYRLVLARKPSTSELQVLHAGFKRTRAQYEADPSAASKLLAVGEYKTDTTLNAAEHASLTTLCLMIFNLDETLTKE